MTNFRTPSSQPPPAGVEHPSTEVFADLLGGLLESDVAAAVDAHLLTCARCRADARDLVAIPALLAASVAGPEQPMPGDLAVSIDALLRTTATGIPAAHGASAPVVPDARPVRPTATSAAPAAGDGMPRTDTRRRRARRTRAIFGLAAASAGVLLIGSAIVHPPGASQQAESADSESADTAVESRGSYQAPGAERDDGPAAPGAAGEEYGPPLDSPTPDYAALAADALGEIEPTGALASTPARSCGVEAANDLDAGLLAVRVVPAGVLLVVDPQTADGARWLVVPSCSSPADDAVATGDVP